MFTSKLTALAMLAIAGLTTVVSATPLLTAELAGTTLIMRQLSDLPLSSGLDSLSLPGLPSPNAAAPSDSKQPVSEGQDSASQQGPGKCTPGAIQCCDEFVAEDHPSYQHMLEGAIAKGLLRRDALLGGLGIQCSPINIIGTSLTDQW